MYKYCQNTSFKFYRDLNQLVSYVTSVPVSLPELYHPYRSHITLGPSNRIWDNTSSCHSVKPAQSLICNTENPTEHLCTIGSGTTKEPVTTLCRMPTEGAIEWAAYTFPHRPLMAKNARQHGLPTPAVQAVTRAHRSTKTGNRAAPNNLLSPIISQRGNFLPLWSFLHVSNYTNSEASLGVWDGSRD